MEPIPPWFSCDVLADPAKQRPIYASNVTRIPQVQAIRDTHHLPMSSIAFSDCQWFRVLPCSARSAISSHYHRACVLTRLIAKRQNLFPESACRPQTHGDSNPLAKCLPPTVSSSQQPAARPSKEYEACEATHHYCFQAVGKEQFLDIRQYRSKWWCCKAETEQEPQW